MGICLGMQLFMGSGTEGEPESGLSYFAGSVELLQRVSGLKLPHMGWNSLSRQDAHPLLEGLRPTADYYFAHSFVVRPEDPDVVVAITQHGQDFASVIARQNVIGFQFHPEKSPPMGSRILRRFLDWHP